MVAQKDWKVGGVKGRRQVEITCSDTVYINDCLMQF